MPDDARAAWNQALGMSPDNPEVLNNAAMAQMTDGDAAGAESLLRRAVAQPAATLQMRLNLAMVLGLQGKIGEAEQIIRRDLPPEVAERNLEWLRNQPGRRRRRRDRRRLAGPGPNLVLATGPLAIRPGLSGRKRETGLQTARRPRPPGRSH